MNQISETDKNFLSSLATDIQKNKKLIVEYLLPKPPGVLSGLCLIKGIEKICADKDFIAKYQEFHAGEILERKEFFGKLRNSRPGKDVVKICEEDPEHRCDENIWRQALGYHFSLDVPETYDASKLYKNLSNFVWKRTDRDTVFLYDTIKNSLISKDCPEIFDAYINYGRGDIKKDVLSFLSGSLPVILAIESRNEHALPYLLQHLSLVEKDDSLKKSPTAHASLSGWEEGLIMVLNSGKDKANEPRAMYVCLTSTNFTYIIRTFLKYDIPIDEYYPGLVTAVVRQKRYENAEALVSSPKFNFEVADLENALFKLEKIEEENRTFAVNDLIDKIKTSLGIDMPVIRMDPEILEFAEVEEIPDIYDVIEMETFTAKDFLEASRENIILIHGKNSLGFTKQDFIKLAGLADQNYFYECKSMNKGFVVAPSNIEEARPYAMIRSTANYLVPAYQIITAMQSPYRVFLLEKDKELPYTASIGVVQRAPSRNFRGEIINVVSKDHCQDGTDKMSYNLRIVR